MNKITIVGLGAGDINLMPLGVYKLLTTNESTPIYIRTKEHPVVYELEKQEGFKYQSFDHIYEKYDNFDDVYHEIVNTLIQATEKSNIIYAVPGHPLIAERTVQLLLNQADNANVHIEFAGGQSFLDPLFQAIKIDPIEGFQLLDGTSLRKEDINVQQHLIIGQVYDSFIASEVKLTLMEKLPDTYKVYIVTAAGTNHESVKEVSLYELDREVKLDNLTTVYVPPVKDESIVYKDFYYFKNIIAKLRGPDGCPWDQKQTHESLKKYLIEEVYELLEAINSNEIDQMIEELGDVLLQVVLHAQIGEDEGYFAIEDVIHSISEKMIRRHPHVFNRVKVKDEEEVLKNWQLIKAKEKGNKEKSIFSEYKGLPSMVAAYEIQKVVSRLGFDWKHVEPAITKVKEELAELEEELKMGNPRTSIINEIGDVLFSVINVTRILDIHPEEALHHTNLKFMKRFQYIEEKIKENGKAFQDYTLEELDQMWNEAKKIEKLQK